MAGSYGHVVDENHAFKGVDLLENQGDVYEAVEEMYGMIWWLAKQLRDEDPRFTTDQLVEMARENYKEIFES